MSASWLEGPRLTSDCEVCKDEQSNGSADGLERAALGLVETGARSLSYAIRGGLQGPRRRPRGLAGRMRLPDPGLFSFRHGGREGDQRREFVVTHRAFKYGRVRQAGETGPAPSVLRQGPAQTRGLVDDRGSRRVEGRASASKSPSLCVPVVRKGVLGMATALLCVAVAMASPGDDERGAFPPSCLAGRRIPAGTLGADAAGLVSRIDQPCKHPGSAPLMQSLARASAGRFGISGGAMHAPQIGHDGVAASPATGGGWIPEVPGLPDRSVSGSAQSDLGRHASAEVETVARLAFPDHGIRPVRADPGQSMTTPEGIGGGGRGLAPEWSRPETPRGAAIGHGNIGPRLAPGSLAQLSGDFQTNPDGRAGLEVAPAGEEAPAETQLVQVVDLGTSGSITLRQEGGIWISDEGSVEDGASITAANGSSYRLRYRYGHWSAELVREVRRIVGTDLRATWLEDRSGYRVGTTALLSKEGRGDVAVNGVMWRVWEENGSLWGARFDAPPHGPKPADGHYSIGLGGQIARLVEDDEKTAANEAGTRIEVGGGNFTMAELLGEGSASSAGERIVPDVLAEVTELRDTAQALLSSLGNDPGSRDFLQSELVRLWQDVLSNIRRIFTGSVQKWKALSASSKAIERREGGVERFDAVISALSSLEAFQAATKEDGVGVFREAGKSEAGAASLFGARVSRSNAILAVTGDTRYGAVKTEVRRQRRAESAFALSGRGAGAGVFAYSTIPDTERTSQISLSGNSTYRGGTTAIDGEGRFYTGNIELEVRFVNETVHGLITGLSKRGGSPWVYERGEVDAIFLPEAKIEFDADWTARTRQSNSALIDYKDKFARSLAVSDSSFEGHLLGTGARAGHQAVGSWSIGVPRDKSEYLAGAFGAVVVEDPQEDGQSSLGIPENAALETTVLPAGSDIEDGVLTLVGTLHGPNLATTLTPAHWDDETLLLDEGRKIADVYKLRLEEAFSRNGTERDYVGRNLIRLAFEEIADLREDLEAVAGLGDDRVALRERSRIWDQINQRVQARVFGTADKALTGRDFANDEAVSADDPRKWSSGYPMAGDGSPEDSSALQEIDAVLAALRSPRALAGAVAENEGGVFTRSDGSAFRPLASGQIDEIWDRVEGRIKLWTEATDYTRFGAWRKQTAPNAWSGYRDRTENDENGPSAFAYSPIPPASYNDYRFPAGGTSKYTGRTVAVQGQSFYTGTVELSARWHEPRRGQYDAGILTAVISGLETAEGDALQYADSDAGGGTQQSIGQIYFDGIRIGIDRQRRLHFSDTLPEVLGIEFEGVAALPVNLSGDPSVTASLTGKFIGRTPEGPQGAIGIWTLRAGNSYRIGTGATIHGAFGVEIDP